MTHKIIITRENMPESEIQLADRLTVGRSSENLLVINDGNTSRRHAEIRKHGAHGYRIVDLGSANGTWVNARRITAPRDLEDGDTIAIGNALIRYVASGDSPAKLETTHGESTMATSVSMRNETIVIMVTDIRNYTGMSESLPPEELSRLVSDWFRESGEIVEEHGGTIDKFIGDALMAYWIVGDPANPAEEVSSALVAARKTVNLSRVYATRVSQQFKGHTFRVGVGLNVGEAIFGNVGTSVNPSFTIVGDTVNVAFRLEALSKEKDADVVASRAIVENASKWFKFADLGEVQVKGRQEPVAVCSFEV